MHNTGCVTDNKPLLNDSINAFERPLTLGAFRDPTKLLWSVAKGAASEAVPIYNNSNRQGMKHASQTLPSSSSSFIETNLWQEQVTHLTPGDAGGHHVGACEPHSSMQPSFACFYTHTNSKNIHLHDLTQTSWHAHCSFSSTVVIPSLSACIKLSRSCLAWYPSGSLSPLSFLSLLFRFFCWR